MLRLMARRGVSMVVSQQPQQRLQRQQQQRYGIVLSQQCMSRRSLSSNRSSSSNKSKSSSNSVMDIFHNLRWRAAEVLTSGLSAEEKAQLMGKLDISQPKHQDTTSVANVTTTTNKNDNDIDNDDTNVQHTIGEAVAAARMEEAKRLESKWEKEREQLWEQAEAAARARVENDVKIQERRFIAMQQWQRELDKENNKAEAVPQQQQQQGAVEQAQPTAEHFHPLLGPVVADFGYKKVYKVSAKTLTSIPVWKKQRVYRHDRAKVIAADKMKTLHLGLPGVLVLHEDPDGKLSILDGQHRVGALALLSEKAPEGMDLENILVEVFTSGNDMDLAEDIFVEINKSEPIKLVDMPGVAKAGDRKIITAAAGKFHEQYPDMFSSSQKCRPPHLNVDNLRDALFAADVLKRHDIKSATALVNWLQAQNEVLAAKFEDPDLATKVNAKALDKAKKFDFYLGMDSSWLYN